MTVSRSVNWTAALSGSGVGCADQDGHAEGGSEACRGASAGPVADDAKGGAAQFLACVAGPAAFTDRGGDLHEPAGGHYDQPMVSSATEWWFVPGALQTLILERRLL